ncbi:MepB family protein [Corynebacterium casei]|uniref:MepB family protein n=1 Tax=Corynebacterium casei TaxID=160386 RepID=UPI003F95C707
MQFRMFEEYACTQGIDVEVVLESQNSDYESGVVMMNGEKWHIRTARNTPRKPGAFVAFWCRNGKGETVPFKADEGAAGLLVFTGSRNRRGVFRFSAKALEELGITEGKHAGKRGFRVYPSWCRNLNPQAESTQHAQMPAFQEY